MKRELFLARFITRTDLYAIQIERNGKWIYKPIREPLTDRCIDLHLAGQRTIGAYPSSDSRTMWLVIDIDTLDVETLRQVQGKLEKRNLPYLIEFSGRKGYHLWLFFTEPVSNRAARRLGFKLTRDHEVFPKQDKTSDKHPGNLIKLPLGIHQATGKRCLFLDKQTLAPVEDSWDALRTTPCLSPEALPKPRPRKARSRPIPYYVADVRPCVSSMLSHGVTEGRRNETAFMLAVELRRAGRSWQQTFHTLCAWNELNAPPLPQREVRAVVSSAFRRPYRSSCHPTSKLRQVIHCPGRCNCPWYQQKRMERSMR